MREISQAQEEGRVHIPPPQGTWSATYLIQAFKVKVAVKKGKKKQFFLKEN